MSSASIGVRSCGVCTDLRSVTLSCLAIGGCQKRALPSDFHFLLISCVIEEKDPHEINTLLSQVVLNACSRHL